MSPTERMAQGEPGNSLGQLSPGLEDLTKDYDSYPKSKKETLRDEAKEWKASIYDFF